MKLRIGILQADSVLPKFRDEFGDYPEMFASLLGDAAQSLPGVDLELVTYRATEMEFPDSAAACDGYLITGSKHSVYDDLPWIPALAEFVGDAIGTGVRVVGICFGHQLLAHFFGGSTQPAGVGWCVGVHETEVIEKPGWMQPDLGYFGLLSSHKDQVAQLPEGAVVFARSAACPYAGFMMGERVLTLQGHPEFPKPYSAALMGHREAILGAETYADGIASLAEDVHSDVVGQWLVNFFAGR